MNNHYIISKPSDNQQVIRNDWLPWRSSLWTKIIKKFFSGKKTFTVKGLLQIPCIAEYMELNLSTWRWWRLTCSLWLQTLPLVSLPEIQPSKPPFSSHIVIIEMLWFFFSKERSKLTIFTLIQSILEWTILFFLSENILSKHIGYSPLNQHKQLLEQNETIPNLHCIEK